MCSRVEPKRRQSNQETEYDETPQEKKLRLAKLYLDQLKEEGKLVLPLQHGGINFTISTCMCLLCDLISSEENKAEEDSFETDLIAGRLQEEVVRVSSNRDISSSQQLKDSGIVINNSNS